MKTYSLANRDRSFTVRYLNEDENQVEVCVKANDITETITTLREFVPFLKNNQNSILAVIEGCDE